MTSDLVLTLILQAQQLQSEIEGGSAADIQTALDCVGRELRKLQEILAPESETYWLGRMTIRGKEILEGFSTQNSQAKFQGKLGFWCQGDCVFIDGLETPQGAIQSYRDKLSKATIGVTHNYHCGSVLALRRADWLNTIRKDPSLNESLKMALSNECP